MPIHASKARQLCTENEYTLFKWSSVKMSKTLSPSQLKQKIERARKLRNKYRDLAKQQRGEARGKRKPTGTRAAQGNERTVEKAQLFTEVLERFEQAQAAVEKAAAKADKSTMKKSSKKVAKKSAKKTAKKAAAKTSRKTGKKAAESTAKKTVKKKSAKTKAKKAAKKTSSAQAKKKKSSTASAAKPSSLPLAGGAGVSKPTLGSGETGHQSPFDALVGGSGKTDIDARRTRRRQSSKAARAGRVESHFARTMQEKIQGHVSGQTKRNQARRDTKN